MIVTLALLVGLSGWSVVVVLGVSWLHREDRALAVIDQSMRVLLQKVDQLMASEQDLQNDLDAIKALVEKQAAAIATLSAAAPGVMSQDQLDALDAEAKAILGAPPAPTT